MNQENESQDNTRSYVQLSNGTEVGHYRIINRIGSGGMGEVFLAEDTNLNRKVALKFLPNYLVEDESAKTRFTREAQAAAKLNHPNIVHIYEVDEFKGRPFFSMEYVEGKSLGDYSKERKLDINEILNLSIQICEGLQEAHLAGIVHRDIKPSNIVVDKNGRAHLLDFGLAKIDGGRTLTQPGSTLGTFGYMSPEQAKGKEVDRRSDIFSFGVVLFEMIATKRPFESDDEAALLHAITHDEPEPLARYKRGVPEEIQRIATKALQKDKNFRYQTAADMLVDLKSLIKTLESSFSPIPSSKLSRKSVAVLPLKNMSGNKEDEYFSDGVTEDIITQLSKIGELKVISRTSIMQYKKTKKSLREIAKELDVATILEGSVRHSSGKVRIVGNLIDARTDELVWAETYDRDLKDIFEIQSDVARQIAAALQAKLTLSEDTSALKKPTENLTAYDYYLRGREYYYRYQKQDNENAIVLFKKALELDPNYALALAGLADGYSQRVQKFGYSRNWLESAIETANKAICIDPILPEGYKALGLAYSQKGWYQKTLDANRRAVELNPNYSWAVGNVGWTNFDTGKFDEALRWMIRGVSLNPTTPFGYNGVGEVYQGLGDDANAEKWFKKALELQPDFNFAYEGLIMTSMIQGNYEQALMWGKKMLSINSEDTTCLQAVGFVELFRSNYGEAEKYYQKVYTNYLNEGTSHLFMRHITATLGFIFFKTGRIVDAQRMFDDSIKLAQLELEQGSEWYNVPYEVAIINSIQENKLEAYRWLQKAIDAGWRYYRWALIDPRLENLHNDEKFKKMMADVKTIVDEMRKRVENDF